MIMNEKVTKITKHAYLDLIPGSKPVVYAMTLENPIIGKIFVRLKEAE